MSDRYFKAKYHVEIDMHGTTEIRYVYGHYQKTSDIWSFKDYDGSTLINLCFTDNYYNKLNAIIDIYKEGKYCEEITEEEYINLS